MNRDAQNPGDPTYRFGDCEVDSARREVRRDGATVGIEPKALDLLIYLIEHRDRVVQKEELQEAIWPRVMVTEASLTRCIMKARRAVGDDAERQQVIKTVHGAGYRFIAPLNAAKPSAPGVHGTAGAAALQRPDKPSLVVLPFTNLSGTPEAEMLADGLTQDIITDLSRNGWLFVIAPNSSFSYKNQTITSRQVAEQLGVRYLVEGSVRMLGDRIRVSADLVDADTAAQEWAERYDRPVTDVFQVQDEIARGIVASLGSELRKAEGRRARHADPATLDARGLVHRGMAISWSTFNQHTNAEAERLYRRAIEINPDDPRAHAFLANSVAMKATNGWSEDVRGDRREAWQEAKVAMDSAPDDPIVLGQIGHMNSLLGHPKTAIQLLERSVELDPNNAFSIGVLSYALTAAGRAEEAVQAVNDVMRLSPRDPAVHWYLTMLAWAYLQLEQFEAAAEQARKSIAHYNGWQPPWITLGVALAATGELDAARQAVVEGCRLAPDVPRWGFEDFFRYMARNPQQGDRFASLVRDIWDDDQSP